MQSYQGRFEPTRFDDLTVTVDFHCHSACRFCIVQEGMNYYRGVPFDTFKAAVDRNVEAPRFRRVIFTGGEVTLERRLFDYLAYARASGSFEHIRLQTNARLLADEDFAAKLIDAGVDEFFVSLHGFDAATQDHISQRAGSFDEAMAGIANIKRLGACLMTNTVLTTLNVDCLSRIVEVMKPFEPARMEFWNYLPMEDYADTRDLLAPMNELAPALRDALTLARSFDIPTAVKYVPRCLLGDFGECLDNGQPDVVIVEEFYDKYPKFACVYEASCEHSESCLGLHHPYITKFGWEESLLKAFPRTTPWTEPVDGEWLESDRPRQGEDKAPTQDPGWRALIEGVAETHGARLDEVLVQRRACTFRFSLEQTRVDVVLVARDDEATTLARSRAFNIFYRNVTGTPTPALAALIKGAIERIIERDTGRLSLDQRKGLVGPEAFRRPSRPTPAPAAPDLSDPVVSLRERGYAVFERAYDAQEVEYLRDLLTSKYEALGRPALDSNPPTHPAPDVEIGPAGMVLLKLTKHHPELAQRLFKPHIIAAIRGLLGDDMHLELVAGAVSDASRPFFDWHVHIGGVDDATLGNNRQFRRYERSERVTALLYLDDLNDDNGKLLVHPRRLQEPTEPPYDVKSRHWEGQVEIACPAGSFVVLEQCIWHAARPKTTAGLRRFVGSYFAARGVSPTPLFDETLRDWDGSDTLFRSLLP